MRSRTALWRDGLLYGAVWTLLGVFAFAQWMVRAQSDGEPFAWRSALGATMLDYYSTGIATPIYVWLVRRFPLAPPRPAVMLLYLAVMSACVVLKWLIHVPLANAYFGKHWTVPQMLFGDSFGVVVAQLVFIVMLIAIDAYRTARRTELRASELQAQLSSAQLEALRSQLHPHFLFNTLNGVSALMHRDVAAADAMLSRLSEMLRLTVYAESGQETTLRAELQTVRLYLGIMDARFGERLVSEIRVPEALLDERVPAFLLQPLVENAVRHGTAGSSRTTRISITAEARDRELLLCVADDGSGLPAGSEPREGIGLRNTRRRLEQLYGGAASLRVADRDGGGVEVVIGIPRRAGVIAAG